MLLLFLKNYKLENSTHLNQTFSDQTILNEKIGVFEHKSGLLLASDLG